MTDEPTTYDLGELCELADVTPRTVRYYLQQGLLPSPGRQGPATRYDRGHLDRLRLVKRLQREHLPLAEIRRRLEEVDDDAVRALLQEPAPPPPARASSAVDYIREVLAGTRSQPAPRLARPTGPNDLKKQEVGGRSAPAADAAPRQTIRPYVAEAPAPAATPTTTPPPAPGRSTWERIVLAPDVELHVRRPLTRAHGKLVDRLVAEARTLFDEDR